MVKSKIAEKLLRILNKEITKVEIEIPNYTEDNPSYEVTLKNISEDITALENNNLSLSLPVYVEGYVAVIIIFTNQTAMKSSKVKTILNNAKIKYEYSIIPAIAAQVTDDQINQLAQLAEVTTIEFDDYVSADLDTARKWFEVDKSVKHFGVTGHVGRLKPFTKADNVIAILDTGIDINHVDLGSGKVIGWHDEITPGSTTPYDDNGHGTHVASTAAGLGKAIWSYRGVAYGSALVGVKVLNATGFGTYSQIISGMQWCILNKIAYGIRVINMSLSGDPNEAVRAVASEAVKNGIVMVCSAGNNGPGFIPIGSPGDTPEVITVGAMSDVGQGGYFLTDFSSRGPGYNGVIKPDIVGPGYNITAAKAGTTNQYTTLSGTSMSTPFVSGVVALMLALNETLTPAQIKTTLQKTAQPWGSPIPNNDYGFGRIQPFTALNAVCRIKEVDSRPMWSSHCSFNYDNFCDVSTKCEEPNIPWEQPQHYAINKTIAEPYVNDWYDFFVDKIGYPVGITVLSNTLGSNINVFVYNSNFELIASSTETNRQDTITFIPVYLGKYLIKITRVTGVTVNYQLDLSVFGNNFNWYRTN